MTTTAPNPQKKVIDYGSSDFNSWIDRLKQYDTQSAYLSVFTGPYHPDKADAAKAIARAAGRTFHPFDAAQLVRDGESDTMQIIEDLFKKYENEDAVFYFANGENLFGIYTGHTFSRIKYATPEERRLMRLIDEHQVWTAISVESVESSDMMLKRKAQQFVNFPLPSSPFKRMRFKLGRYTFHGYETPSVRTSPELG